MGGRRTTSVCVHIKLHLPTNYDLIPLNINIQEQRTPETQSSRATVRLIARDSNKVVSLQTRPTALPVRTGVSCLILIT